MGFANEAEEVFRMAIEVFINFNGNCREALGFYERVFDVKATRVMTFAEVPNPAEMDIPEVPEAHKDLICYASMNVGGSEIMFSDVLPGMPLTVGNNMSITYVSKDPEEIRKFFNGMKDGGTIAMTLQKTFWSDLYGMVIDKYGIPWQFNLDSGKF